MNVAATLLGIGLLALGAHLLVEGGRSLAASAGVSEAVIGLTIVAAGTSMPELITSLVASFRGRDDMAVANILGSNIFNILGIAGLTAVIHPLSVVEEIFVRDIPWMCAISIALLPIMWTGQRISRGEGVLLLGTFTVYSGVLLRAAVG